MALRRLALSGAAALRRSQVRCRSTAIAIRRQSRGHPGAGLPARGRVTLTAARLLLPLPALTSACRVMAPL